MFERPAFTPAESTAAQIIFARTARTICPLGAHTTEELLVRVPVKERQAEAHHSASARDIGANRGARGESPQKSSYRTPYRYDTLRGIIP